MKITLALAAAAALGLSACDRPTGSAPQGSEVGASMPDTTAPKDGTALQAAPDAGVTGDFMTAIIDAAALDKLLADLGTALDLVMELVVDDDEVIRRLSGRRTCRGCGKIWHVEFDAPTREGVCDRCGSQLFQRDDDKPETVRKRLSVYHELTEPLIEWYTDRDLLVRFDGTRSPDEVNDRIRATLATKRLEAEL